MLANFYTLSFIDYVHEATHLLTLLTLLTYVNLLNLQHVCVCVCVCVYIYVYQVSKRYDIRLPIGKPCNKKIMYTNPYGCEKVFRLRTNQPKLLSFRDNVGELAISAKGQQYIGLRFASRRAGLFCFLVGLFCHYGRTLLTLVEPALRLATSRWQHRSPGLHQR